MAKMNLLDALEAALTATKAYIDDNHYNQSEVDGLLSALESELTTEINKKANESHGTHVTYATATPKANGTAAVGTSGKVAREDHVHPLQTSVSGNAGSANKVNNALKVQLNGGTTEGTNQFTFDGSGAKTVNITPASIGAAGSSHGTHVTYGGNGSAATVSRSDHTHNYAGSSSAGGAATSANKVNSNLTIKINGGATEGTDLFTFNGSSAKTIDLTASSLGLSASGHTHDDRYYTEGEVDAEFVEVRNEIQSVIDGFDEKIAGEKERAEGAEANLQTAINNEVSRAKTAEAKALTDAKSYTDTKVAGILDSAPEALNTLNELAAALGDDPNFSTTIMTEIGKKADAQHGNHVPAVETANNAKFLRNDNTWATVTPANIGAAKADHGTHVTWATNAPKANGTAAIGSAGRVAREDHVHPLQTTVSGNAGSANKVNNALKVQLNSGTTEGTNQFTFDGSGAKTINITPSSIGASASSHTHSSYVNQNAFSNVTVGSTTIAADTATDTLTLVAGSNVTITPDADNDKITIAAKDTVYTHPTHTAYNSGLYKVTVNNQGHVTAATAVAKADITALGIPAQDTVYTHPSDGANTGSFGNSSNQTPGYGKTFNVPYITVNAAGHVTAIKNTTVQIPASDNTWRGVQNILTSTATDQSLSAAQGKVLNESKADKVEDTDLEAMLTSIFGSTATGVAAE